MPRLFLIAFSLLCAGCAQISSLMKPDVSQEDRDFYYRGWINPHRDLDQPETPSHFGNTPGSPGPGNYKADPLID